ncbi:hypothetical protein CLF_101509, partial [Clonorchis sinensis]
MPPARISTRARYCQVVHRDAEIGFEPRTFRSVNLHSDHCVISPPQVFNAASEECFAQPPHFPFRPNIYHSHITRSKLHANELAAPDSSYLSSLFKFPFSLLH